jgi:hypothetical protein
MAKGVESRKNDADASGAYPVGVRGFKSHPLHHRVLERILFLFNNVVVWLSPIFQYS